MDTCYNQTAARTRTQARSINLSFLAYSALALLAAFGAITYLTQPASQPVLLAPLQFPAGA